MPSATIAVIGTGASALIDELLVDGHRVIANDISATPLALVRSRVGEHDRLVTLTGDARTLAFAEPIDAWHDRAVFHFLTTAADRAAYAAAAARAVHRGGHVVLAAFARSGPTQCSGLVVHQHDKASIIDVFAPAFNLIESFETDHTTPSGAIQRFTHAVLRRC